MRQLFTGASYFVVFLVCAPSFLFCLEKFKVSISSDKSQGPQIIRLEKHFKTREREKEEEEGASPPGRKTTFTTPPSIPSRTRPHVFFFLSTRFSNKKRWYARKTTRVFDFDSLFAPICQSVCGLPAPQLIGRRRKRRRRFKISYACKWGGSRRPLAPSSSSCVCLFVTSFPPPPPRPYSRTIE